MMELSNIKSIKFPTEQKDILFAHCMRKYKGEYLDGEAEEKRAYGLIAGVIEDKSGCVKKICPLKKSVRYSNEFEKHMTRLMKEYAVPSETPFEMRGWVSDPEEMFEIYNMCDREDFILIGSYHMHLVPWEGDPLRDTPTLVDEILAKGSDMFQFIISFVNPRKPFVNAFFEGILTKKIPIV